MLSDSWLRLDPSNSMMDSLSGLPLDNRGLAYGDGFFTTMGVIDGQILWADYHQQRMISHAKALQLTVDIDALLVAVQRQAVRLQQGMLKLIVTRATQHVRGYGYSPNAAGRQCEIWLKSSIMTVSTAAQMCLPNGYVAPMQPDAAAICLSSQIACLPPSLAGIKSLNRLDHVLASAELQSIKADPLASGAISTLSEGLLRDMSGHWVEGTMSNVFYQLKDAALLETKNLSGSDKDDQNCLTTGQWYTPSMAHSGVAGVMRQVVMDALSTSDHPVEIRSIRDEDLPQLSKLFFCNALRGIMPIRCLTLLNGEVVKL